MKWQYECILSCLAVNCPARNLKLLLTPNQYSMLAFITHPSLLTQGLSSFINTALMASMATTKETTVIITALFLDIYILKPPRLQSSKQIQRMPQKCWCCHAIMQVNMAKGSIAKMSWPAAVQPRQTGRAPMTAPRMVFSGESTFIGVQTHRQPAKIVNPTSAVLVPYLLYNSSKPMPAKRSPMKSAKPLLIPLTNGLCDVLFMSLSLSTSMTWLMTCVAMERLSDDMKRCAVLYVHTSGRGQKLQAVKTTMLLRTESLNLVSWLRLERVLFHQGLGVKKAGDARMLFNMASGRRVINQQIMESNKCNWSQNHLPESDSISKEDSELLGSFVTVGCSMGKLGFFFSLTQASSCQSCATGSFSMSKVRSGRSLFSDTIFQTPARCYLGRDLISSQSFLFSMMVIGFCLSWCTFGTVGALGFLGCLGVESLVMDGFLTQVGEGSAQGLAIGWLPLEAMSFVASLSISVVMKQMSEPFWLYLQLFIQMSVRSSLNCLKEEQTRLLSFLSIVERSIGVLTISKQSGIFSQMGSTASRKGFPLGFFLSWERIARHWVLSSYARRSSPKLFVVRIEGCFILRLGSSSSGQSSTFFDLILLVLTCASSSSMLELSSTRLLLGSSCVGELPYSRSLVWASFLLGLLVFLSSWKEQVFGRKDWMKADSSGVRSKVKGFVGVSYERCDCSGSIKLQTLGGIPFNRPHQLRKEQSKLHTRNTPLTNFPASLSAPHLQPPTLLPSASLQTPPLISPTMITTKTHQAWILCLWLLADKSELPPCLSEYLLLLAFLLLQLPRGPTLISRYISVWIYVIHHIASHYIFCNLLSQSQAEMWSFATSVFEKVVGFAPVKTICQNLFQKFSSDFLEKEPIFNFKEGVLDLESLQLAPDKLNQSFLQGSPYVLARGSINTIRVTMPSSQDRKGKNVEVKVRGVVLEMEPNQLFKESFERGLNLIKNSSSEDPPTKETKGQSLTFFKRIIQEFLSNIQVEVDDVVIKVFLSTPRKEGSLKAPQHYLMVRVPSMLFERVNDNELGKLNEDFLKYKMIVPQVSVHLMKDDLKVPDYCNVSAASKDIPFLYPSVTHSSTILLVGRQQPHSSQKPTLLVFRISKDVKNKTKQLCISVDVPNIEAIIEPKQFVVLSKYAQQIKGFKDVYIATIAKIKSEVHLRNPIDESNNFELPNSQKDSLRKPQRISAQFSRSIDIFSSFAVSLENIGLKEQRLPSYLDAVLEGDWEIKEELDKIQESASAEIKAEAQQDPTYTFKSTKTFKVGVEMLRLCVVKCETSSDFFDFRRVWSSNESNTAANVNLFINSGYVIVRADQFAINHEAGTTKLTTVTLQNFEILDVRLNNSFEQHSLKHIPEAPQSSTTISISESVDIFKSFDSLPTEGPIKQLVTAQIDGDKRHFCSKLILSVSNKPPSSTSGLIYRHNNPFSFLRPLASNKPSSHGICVRIQQHQKSKVITTISNLWLVVDDRLIQDLVQMWHPLLACRGMSASNKQFSQSPKKKMKIINHSIYDFNDQVGDPSAFKKTVSSGSDQQHKKNHKVEYVLEVGGMFVLLPHPSKKLDLVETYKSKTTDYDLAASTCHCEHSSGAAFLTFNSLLVKKNLLIKVEFEELSIKFVEVLGKSGEEQNSDLARIHEVIHVSRKQKCLPRVLIETLHIESISKKQRIGVYLPKLGITLTQPLLLSLLQLSEDTKSKFHDLTELSRYLREEVNKLSDTQVSPEAKKLPTGTGKMAQTVNVHVEKLGLQVISYELLLKNVLCKKDETIILKFFEGILTQPNQPQLKLQNHWKKSESSSYRDRPHEDTFSSYGVKPGVDRVVAFLEKSENVPPPGEIKDSEYFQILLKLPAPVHLQILIPKGEAKKESPSLCKLSPDFSKPKATETLPKTINIHINSTVIVKLCEFKSFKTAKKCFDEIEDMFKTSPLFKTNNEKRKSSHDFSSQSPPPNTLEQKLTLNLSVNTLHLDVFPSVLATSTEQILSFTRSFTTIEGLKLSMIESKSMDLAIETKRFNAKWKQLNVYFLTFMDAELELNKEVVTLDELESLGFKRMLDLRAELEFQETKSQSGKRLEMAGEVLELDSTVSSKSLSSLMEHVSHIVETFNQANKTLQPQHPHPPHEVKNPSFDCDSESSAEDLTQIQRDFATQKQKRETQQSTFICHPIQLPKRDESPHLLKKISLKHLEIRRACLKITDKNDYDFQKHIPTGEGIPLAIELDERLETAEELFGSNGLRGTAKRIRKKDKREGTILKVQLENTTISIEKFVDSRNLEATNVGILMSIKDLECHLFLPEENPFSLIRTIDRLELLLDIQQHQIRAKTSGRRLELGFTSAVNYVVKDFSEGKERNKKSIFSKNQQQPPTSSNLPIHSHPIDLIVYIPQMSVTLSLKLVGCKFINNQSLTVSSFFFHNVLSTYMQDDNKETLKAWIKGIITGNLGGLLGNSVGYILSNGLMGLLGCVKQLVLLPGHAIKALTS